MSLREAAQQALEALEMWGEGPFDSSTRKGAQTRTSVAITALRTALAEPEQEPVAWGVFEGSLHDMFFTREEAQEVARLKGVNAVVQPLYTHSPQRTEPEQEQAIVDALTTGTGWTRDGKRVDPTSVYLEPEPKERVAGCTLCGYCAATGELIHPPQRKPLTDEQVLEILGDLDPETKRLPPGLKAFARAIEAAHGIKQEEA